MRPKYCVRLLKRSVCLDVVGSGEEPLIHQGRTAVDLNSCAGSLLVVALVVFASFHTNEEG